MDLSFTIFIYYTNTISSISTFQIYWQRWGHSRNWRRCRQQTEHQHRSWWGLESPSTCVGYLNCLPQGCSGRSPWRTPAKKKKLLNIISRKYIWETIFSRLLTTWYIRYIIQTNYCISIYCTYLYLHFEMSFEVGEQCHKYGEWEMKDLRDGRHTILAESHTQVLFDGRDEGLIGAENTARILDNWQQHLQRQNLGPKLMRSVGVNYLDVVSSCVTQHKSNHNNIVIYSFFNVFSIHGTTCELIF